ncbi:reversion-inducing cysteine-rich protein with Kazal motifs [Trichonephila inaurata madagascariensis]|uniref:Reversion-inducing cysteine-rich protein with Kazal motifs n=1 Tax=Trichonephila inaurata madagascariensis TaxID=2747483 RepID=A0A8X6Y433_9ARAC|nr:reversion-inducing cysteine-rich protein with Kazal motifs [Trichonephila inaurata madagascariensis]
MKIYIRIIVRDRDEHVQHDGLSRKLTFADIQNDLRIPLLVAAPHQLVLAILTRREGMILTSSCCTLATGSCRATCEEISLVDLATNNDDRWRYISKLSSFCSEQLVPFWSCMNETLTEIDKGQGFFGRPCCTLPQSQACIMVCLQAKDRDELISACRPSNEITFYSCLERQEVGQQCCSRAGKPECASACKELFASTTEPSVQLRTYVNNMCAHDHPSVSKCVKNYTLLHQQKTQREIFIVATGPRMLIADWLVGIFYELKPSAKR